MIMTTGRSNYRQTGEALGLDLIGYPAQLELPEAACRSAGYFWQSRKLNELADGRNFKLVTRRINGGFNGFADRLAFLDRAESVLA